MNYSTKYKPDSRQLSEKQQSFLDSTRKRLEFNEASPYRLSGQCDGEFLFTTDELLNLIPKEIYTEQGKYNFRVEYINFNQQERWATFYGDPIEDTALDNTFRCRGENIEEALFKLLGWVYKNHVYED